MNRIFLSLFFVLAACGEVVPVNGADVDAGETTDGDGGTGDGDGGVQGICDGPSIALADLDTCFRQMQCEFMVRCLPGFPDLQFCESRVFDFFSEFQEGFGGPEQDGPTKLFFEIIGKADAAGVANYNGDRAFRCLKSVSESSCQSNFGEGDKQECDNILTGNTAENGDCFDDYECEAGARCERDGFSCATVGSCVMGLPLNASCSNGQRCLPGLECIYMDDIIATCQDGKANSFCNDSGDCASDFYCSDTTCVADRAPGAACVNNEECPGDQLCVDATCSSVSVMGDPCRDQCFGNLFCDTGDPSNVTCKPLPAPTQPCGAVPTHLLSRCGSVDHVCSGGPSPTCLPKLAPGSLCTSAGLIGCALGSFCSVDVGGTPGNCIAPQGNNFDCAAARHCSSGFCTGNGANFTCQTYVPCWE